MKRRDLLKAIGLSAVVAPLVALANTESTQTITLRDGGGKIASEGDIKYTERMMLMFHKGEWLEVARWE